MFEITPSDSCNFERHWFDCKVIEVFQTSFYAKLHVKLGFYDSMDH